MRFIRDSRPGEKYSKRDRPRGKQLSRPISRFGVGIGIYPIPSRFNRYLFGTAIYSLLGFKHTDSLGTFPEMISAVASFAVTVTILTVPVLIPGMAYR